MEDDVEFDCYETVVTEIPTQINQEFQDQPSHSEAVQEQTIDNTDNYNNVDAYSSEDDRANDSDSVDLEDDSEIVGLSDTAKNEDGTLTESGQRKFQNESWFDYPWDCSICDTRMSSVSELRSHLTAAHPDTTMQYKCTDCPNVFQKYVTFVNHVWIRHRPHLKYWLIIIFISILRRHLIHIYF